MAEAFNGCLLMDFLSVCQVEPGCQADSGPRRQHGDSVGQGRPTQGGVRGVL